MYADGCVYLFILSFYLSYFFLSLDAIVPFVFGGLFLHRINPAVIPWAYRSIFSQPCDLASFPEVFSRTMTTNVFLEVAFVVRYGVHVAVASFSSVACWQGGFPREFVAMLFEIPQE